jgi:hypothetical protein
LNPERPESASKRGSRALSLHSTHSRNTDKSREQEPILNKELKVDYDDLEHSSLDCNYRQGGLVRTGNLGKTDGNGWKGDKSPKVGGGTGWGTGAGTGKDGKSGAKRGSVSKEDFMQPWKRDIDTPNLYLVKDG